ncbi:MAG: hypothetical protein NTZ05_01385 [Chloroflexi bacterium]|nr:hypothetical protein [Chloroflexota bacterium]
MIRSYGLHGLHLQLETGDAGLLGALDARLKLLPAAPGGAPDFVFAFHGPEAAGQRIVAAPTSPERLVYDPPGGAVWYHEASDLLHITFGEMARVVCDPALGRADIVTGVWSGAARWLLSHPLFTIPLTEMLKRRGVYSLHAGGVALNGRSLLLPGAGGSGKTTLTLALLRAGWDLLGDDTALLHPEPEGLRVRAFPDEADVTDATAAMFPELRHLAGRPRAEGWPKHSIPADSIAQTTVAWETRPAALIFPHIARTNRSVLHPLSAMEALVELVPNVLLTDSRSSQAHLDALATLVRSVACYRLDTGLDFAEVSGLLRELLA